VEAHPHRHAGGDAMTPALIATHDQVVHAITERVSAVGTPALRRVVLSVLAVHVAHPSPTGRPEPDCPGCQGTGLVDLEDSREHCHCRCPWCDCDQPLCAGPCLTVGAIADAVGIISG